MSKLTKALTAAAGNAGAGALYVEDVFSTYLYVGNSSVGSTQSNGLDLSGEGGLVWIKNRGSATTHALFDTERGGTNYLTSSGTAAASTGTDGISFLSNGWSTAPNGVYDLNSMSADYASWSFRKAEKFFDVVTYTGNGSVQSVNHNLDSVPACMIVKRTDSTGTWYVYHVDLGAGINGRKTLKLNSTLAQSDSGGFSDHPTDTAFTVNYAANTSGATYVAYLFASDAGGFGDDETESIIKCGSVSYNGGATVDLGFEPQWVLVKTSDAAGNWVINDNMRGMPNGSRGPRLDADTSNAEFANATVVYPTATGFIMPSGLYDPVDLIYIAIRRPMKTPESGTEVFSVSDSMSGAVQPSFDAPHVVDMAFQRRPAFTQDTHIASRLTGIANLYTNTTAAEVNQVENVWDFMDGWGGWTVTNTDYRAWNFKRATGFFDVVAYTGANSNGNQSLAVNHNLGVVPEFIICKNRGRAAGWISYHKDLNGGVNPQDYYIYLERTTAAGGPDGIAWGTSGGGGVAPTATNFTVGGYYDNGYAGDTYISYLFATVAGVSKVGSYTGTGADLNVDCGFSAGARFILIKRTDSTGDWYVYDSVRGIVAGNDPYLLLNSTAAEVTNTDYIDPLSSGFTVTSSAPAALNASGGSYIFLAIA